MMRLGQPVKAVRYDTPKPCRPRGTDMFFICIFKYINYKLLIYIDNNVPRSIQKCQRSPLFSVTSLIHPLAVAGRETDLSGCECQRFDIPVLRTSAPASPTWNSAKSATQFLGTISATGMTADPIAVAPSPTDNGRRHDPRFIAGHFPVNNWPWAFGAKL